MTRMDKDSFSPLRRVWEETLWSKFGHPADRFRERWAHAEGRQVRGTIQKENCPVENPTHFRPALYCTRLSDMTRRLPKLKQSKDQPTACPPKSRELIPVRWWSCRGSWSSRGCGWPFRHTFDLPILQNAKIHFPFGAAVGQIRLKANGD